MSKKVVTTIRLDLKAKRALQKLAKKLGISLSRLIEELLWAVLRGDLCIEPPKIVQVRPIVIMRRRK